MSKIKCFLKKSYQILEAMAEGRRMRVSKQVSEYIKNRK